MSDEEKYYNEKKKNLMSIELDFHVESFLKQFTGRNEQKKEAKCRRRYAGRATGAISSIGKENSNSKYFKKRKSNDLEQFY